MIVRTHDAVPLRAGRALLQTDYRPGDGTPGVLSITLVDREADSTVEGRVRLDPWLSNQYTLIELTSGSYFVLCGAQAVIAIDLVSLAWLSSIALEYEEAETLLAPWHVEVNQGRSLLVATERRVWCVDERGAIRWIWSCSTGDSKQISGVPVVDDDRVRVSLKIWNADFLIELHLRDGLPTLDRPLPL